MRRAEPLTLRCPPCRRTGARTHLRHRVFSPTMLSKTAIDKAGRYLAKKGELSEHERIAHELVLDEYRRAHLAPLTTATIQLQRWLDGFQGRYYIAQRLKRKPQIIRKLKRLSVRLVQLQDIAGARIVVPSNNDVDTLLSLIEGRIKSQSSIKIDAVADYRQTGREDSGYRALHVVLAIDGRSVELQLRSEAQHYWAEQIERTSVIYGYHLKELEGDPRVLLYFKELSHIFHELESGRDPAPGQRIDLERARVDAETVILGAEHHPHQHPGGKPQRYSGQGPF